MLGNIAVGLASSQRVIHIVGLTLLLTQLVQPMSVEAAAMSAALAGGQTTMNISTTTDIIEEPCPQLAFKIYKHVRSKCVPTTNFWLLVVFSTVAIVLIITAINIVCRIWQRRRERKLLQSMELGCPADLDLQSRFPFDPYMEYYRDTFTPESHLSSRLNIEKEAEQLVMSEYRSNGEADKVYKNAGDFLASILSEEGITTFEIRRDPCDEKRILVNGEDVEKLQQKLQDELRNAFDGYSVLTKNIVCSQSDSPDLSFWINLFANSTASLHAGEDRLSTIGLLLNGCQLPGFFHPFGATTGHTFMTEDECKKLAVSNWGHAEILEEIARVTQERQPFIKLNDETTLNIVSNPVIVYRHFYRSRLYDETSLAYDMGIFKVNRSEPLLEDELTLSSLDVENSTSWRVKSGIAKANSTLELDKYVGRNVVCNGKKGVIQPSVYLQTEGWILGAYVAFTLSGKGENFGMGDCGSILYLVSQDDPNELHRLGMLIGNLKSDNRIYQAISLSFAIQKIMGIGNPKVTNISPLEKPELDEAQSTIPDSTAEQDQAASETLLSGITQADASDSDAEEEL